MEKYFFAFLLFMGMILSVISACDGLMLAGQFPVEYSLLEGHWVRGLIPTMSAFSGCLFFIWARTIGSRLINKNNVYQVSQEEA